MKVHLSGSDPWLMEPAKFEELRELVANADLPEDAQTRASGSVGGTGSFLVKDGVAQIHVKGTLMKRVPWWARWLGVAMTSTPELGRQISEAGERADVRSIVLLVDSPGGQAAGIEAVGDMIRQVRDTKPVTAVIEDMAASGGYWIASQAKELILAPGGRVGSIGAYLVSVDSSAAAEKYGRKVRVHRSGELKGAGISGAPISDTQLAYFDEFVEEVAADFRAAIAAGRGMTAPQVEALATGRMWRAADAKSHGLVDRVEPVSSALQRVAQATKEARMADENALEEARAQARNEEQERVRAIAKAFPDHPKFANEQIAAGATLAEASVAYVPFLKEEHQKALKKTKAEATESARAEAKTSKPEADAEAEEPTEPVAFNKAAEGPTGFMEKAEAYAKEKGVSMTDAMRHVARTEPETHREYVEGIKPVKLEKLLGVERIR